MYVFRYSIITYNSCYQRYFYFKIRHKTISTVTINVHTNVAIFFSIFSFSFFPVWWRTTAFEKRRLHNTYWSDTSLHKWQHYQFVKLFVGSPIYFIWQMVIDQLKNGLIPTNNFTNWRPRRAYIVNYRPKAMVEYERANNYDHGKQGLNKALMQGQAHKDKKLLWIVIFIID